ncbi:MAG: sulfatase-like hydrolase/transferase, partial [Akkermansiaceae bacterium]|nr:sulfatase-like hydrolase/transferase [Akkermansiaceae bacterium]
GKLMVKLKDLGIDDNTLVVYMNDNGGLDGCKIFNAGMRGGKLTASNGGTRALSLWRWPGTIKPAACDKLTAHLDVFPTFAELAAAKVPEGVASQLDGFSLLPLLKNPQAAWHDERMLFTHVGRWGKGSKPEPHGPCSVRWQQYLQVWEKGRWCLYDLKADPGETIDLAANQKEVVGKLDKAYDAWWATVLPCLDNEQAWQTAPKINPYKEQYRLQSSESKTPAKQ